MIWQNIHILWLLLLIPLLIAGQWWYAKHHKKKRKQFIGEDLFKKLYRGFWQAGNRIKTVCIYIGFAFLIIAAAGPKIGTEVREIEREGIELLIALDLSASMKAEDIKPSRLAKAKYEISRLIDRLQGDRIGLIVFTGSAYVQVPLTLDYTALRMFLDITVPNQMPNTATNIKTAIDMAAQVFAKQTKRSDDVQAAEVLLIISDGENHGDEFDEALKHLREQGIRVYTLGIGTTGGGPIPIYDPETGRLMGYKANDEGETITTALMPQVLENIARQGGGEYYEIGSGSAGIDAFLAEIDRLEQGKFAGKKYADYKNQYQWMAGIGLVFLLISLIFSNFKRKTTETRSKK